MDYKQSHHAKEMSHKGKYFSLSLFSGAPATAGHQILANYVTVPLPMSKTPGGHQPYLDHFAFLNHDATSRLRPKKKKDKTPNKRFVP